MLVTSAGLPWLAENARPRAITIWLFHRMVLTRWTEFLSHHFIVVLQLNESAAPFEWKSFLLVPNHGAFSKTAALGGKIIGGLSILRQADILALSIKIGRSFS